MARHIPSDLWNDQSAVDEYVALTLKYYRPSGIQLQLKECPATYKKPQYPDVRPVYGIIDYATPALLNATCNVLCNCTAPDCRDKPDDPRAHSYCSLCSILYNHKIAIFFFYPQVRKTIVDLAVATPDLSTLVTALKAADLVKTLSSKGPFTVFAPSNKAFAALPEGFIHNLLKPENKAQLVDLLTYHVVSGDVHAKDLMDMQMLKTVEGKNVTVRTVGKTIFIDSSKVTTADVQASNGVVHIIDAVLRTGSSWGEVSPL